MVDRQTIQPPRCDTLEELDRWIGQEVYVSNIVLVDQRRINKFADATEDFQWIHVDPERAALNSPFGRTIAHGFLSLSLLGKFYEEFLPRLIPFAGFGLNYGLNRVRFMAPVLSDSEVRGHFRLDEIKNMNHAVQLTFTATLELVGTIKPVCVAESIVRRQLNLDGV